MTFLTTEEELAFYKSIIEKTPTILSINQLDDPNDPATNFNVWMNKYSIEFIGYEQPEIQELGLQFYLQTMHPEDLEIISQATEIFDYQNHQIFGGLVRLKPKDSHDYFWCLGSIVVLEMKEGKPWRFLVTAQNIDQMTDTQNQITALIKENLQLRNALKINTLTKREKQVIRLISESKTDKEIAVDLYISAKTARTHRHNILRKLHLKNSRSIVRFALENGLN